jgi:hypothetical protein
MRVRFAQQIHPQDIGSFDLIEFDTQHPRLVLSKAVRGERGGTFSSWKGPQKYRTEITTFRNVILMQSSLPEGIRRFGTDPTESTNVRLFAL